MLTRLLAAATEDLKGAMSFAEIRRALCDAFTKAFPGTPGDIEDIYPDHCIISAGSGTLYEVPYTIDENGSVVTGDMTKVRRQVEVNYVKIQAAFRLLAATEIGADDESKGYRWQVQIIEAGPDKQTGMEYPHDVLRAAGPLYDGARVFALQQGQHAAPDNPYGKSVRDLVGWISDVKPNTAGLEGHLNILKSAKWLRDMILDSFERGKPDLVGLSHDVLGKVTAANGKRTVEKIVKVDSVDIVYEPIAGGKITRMAAAAKAGQKEGNMLEKLLAALKAKKPEVYKTIEAKVTDRSITDDEVINLLAAGGVIDVQGLDERISTAVAAAVAGNSSATDEVKILACRLTLKDELRDSGMPEISQERIRKQFDGTVFETEALRAAITSEKEYLDKITGSGTVTGSGQVRIGNEEPEKVQAAFDKLMGVDVDEKFSAVAPFKSIRAAYTRITGDTEVSGQVSREGLRLGQAYMDLLRLPAAYASSSFTYLLGTSMYRRLVQDYRAQDFGEQILISYIRNALDFKTLESVRVGYYGDIPDVDPEALDYAELTNFTDEEISYAINQKGGLVTVSRKTIMNDDLRALQRIPQRLGRAAKRTKAQRCWNKIIDNATYKGDTTALFHNDHSNLGAAALTNDAAGILVLTARLTAMFNQTEPDSLKKLGLEAQYLWVPRELLEIAKGLNSAWPGVAGGNPHAARFGINHERIVTNKLTTDTSDWGLVAAKEDTELLEIAFLNGQEEPEFFVADNPLVGQMFLADKLQYKIRHEYEVEIADYRGFDKSVVG